MSVVDIPIGSLDNESDLMDWLATELVANHRFVERRRIGTVGANDIQIALERPQAETYHNDSEMCLFLDKSDNNETNNIAFQFNISHLDYDDSFQTTTLASVIVDFDTTPGDMKLILQVGGDFTNWVSAGYTAGKFVRITNAATAGNDGLYEISTFSTTTLTSDTLEIREVSNGGIKDFVAADVSDTIGAVEEVDDTMAGVQGFSVSPRSDDIIWNFGCSGLFNTGPYIRARFISNPTSGSATPSEPLNFIVIVESDTGIYRQFSFGEVVKLVEFVGGMYASGSQFTIGQDMDAQHNAWCQGVYTDSFSENFNLGNSPMAVWGSADFTGNTNANEYGRGFFFAGAYGSVSFDAPTQWTMAVMPHYHAIGCEMIGYSPSPFSGQSERWPITCFGAFNDRQYTSTLSNHAPMCVIPDIFLADITNVDAYSVFQDDYGEKFMVVPLYTKTGSGVNSSEKWGYLIRNPDLVVT